MPCLSAVCKLNVTLVSLMQDQRKGSGSSEIVHQRLLAYRPPLDSIMLRSSSWSDERPIASSREIVRLAYSENKD